MIPSLYQRSSIHQYRVPRAPCPVVPHTGCRAVGTSKEILEITLAAHLSANSEDVSRYDVRVELNVITAAVPCVTCAAQEIVHLERSIGVDTQYGQVEVEPCRLRIVRIDIDHGHNHVIAGSFAVADDLVI